MFRWKCVKQVITLFIFWTQDRKAAELKQRMDEIAHLDDRPPGTEKDEDENDKEEAMETDAQPASSKPVPPGPPPGAPPGLPPGLPPGQWSSVWLSPNLFLRFC